MKRRVRTRCARRNQMTMRMISRSQVLRIRSLGTSRRGSRCQMAPLIAVSHLAAMPNKSLKMSRLSAKIPRALARLAQTSILIRTEMLLDWVPQIKWTIVKPVPSCLREITRAPTAWTPQLSLRSHPLRNNSRTTRIICISAASKRPWASATISAWVKSP